MNTRAPFQGGVGHGPTIPVPAADVRKVRLAATQYAAEHSLTIRQARELLDEITPLPEDIA